MSEPREMNDDERMDEMFEEEAGRLVDDPMEPPPVYFNRRKKLPIVTTGGNYPAGSVMFSAQEDCTLKRLAAQLRERGE